MLKGYGVTSSCREYTHPRNDDRAYPKGFMNNDTKIGPLFVLPVTKHFGRYRIETKIVSMMDDGTQSWVVINRGVEEYVTELALDHTQAMAL